MREVFISRKSWKSYENTVKSPNVMLVLVCSEQQMKQVKNYKYKDQECATYGRPYITPGVNHIQPNQHACLCIFKFLN